MRYCRFAAAVIVCSSVFMAGCPNGTDFGVGSGSDVIPDGTYIGDSNGNFESWYMSDVYQQASGGGETSATFANGAVLKDSGSALRRGDIENVDFGGFTASREVTDVQIGQWAYQVSYDVTAQWGNVPMAGTESITFTGNEDGSIAMFDAMELISLDQYDGGAWTFHVNSSGTLYPTDESGYSGGDSSGSPSGNLSNPILDIRSGKGIENDSTTR